MDTVTANKHTIELKKSHLSIPRVVSTYLGDPFEGLCAQLYAIKAKESDGTL